MYEEDSMRGSMMGGSLIVTLIKDYLIYCVVMFVLVLLVIGVVAYKASASKMSNSIKWGNGVSFIRN